MGVVQDFGHAWPLKRFAAAEGLIETEGVVLMVVAQLEINGWLWEGWKAFGRKRHPKSAKSR